MTDVWTERELDATMAALVRDLDRGPATGTDDALRSVRARLLDAAPGVVPPSPVRADVLEIGSAADGPGGRRRLVPALLLAAVLVAAVAAAIAFRPAGDDRSTPPARPAATPSPSSSTQIVAARQDLLLEPVLEGATSVLVSIAGVGDATVSFPSARGGPAATIAYGFDCGDPRFGGDPNGPDNDVSEYRLTDNLGSEASGSCAPIADGIGVASFGTGADLDPAGRAYLRVDVPGEDTVWKLAVTVTVS